MNKKMFRTKLFFSEISHYYLTCSLYMCFFRYNHNLHELTLFIPSYFTSRSREFYLQQKNILRFRSSRVHLANIRRISYTSNEAAWDGTRLLLFGELRHSLFRSLHEKHLGIEVRVTELKTPDDLSLF